VKKDKADGTCSMQCGDAKCIKNCRTPEVKSPLGRPRVADEMIILKKVKLSMCF
jgi:hypothetical protein